MSERIMQAAVCAIGISVATMAASFGQTTRSPNPSRLAQTNAEWAKDVTVLVIAPNGTWGAATEPFIDQAFAKAIASCKSKYDEIGCGYRFTSVRAGWTFAMRCGRENIIVAAKTLQAAEQAGIDAEFDLRRGYAPAMPPCVRAVTVDPDGGIVAPDVARLLRFVMDR